MLPVHQLQSARSRYSNVAENKFYRHIQFCFEFAYVLQGVCLSVKQKWISLSEWYIWQNLNIWNYLSAYTY